METSAIQFKSDVKKIQDIVLLYQNGGLNLNPGFQRDSVWKTSERSKLIDSIIRNYPLPSIFLYQRRTDGELKYDVIDGKQRIESILMYMGIIKGNKYSSITQLPGTTERKRYSYNDLQKNKKQFLITGYELQTIEVNGELSDIIDLFVRINSTGKALTSSEKRHARYYRSKILKTASILAEKNKEYFITSRILTKDQINRKKHIELILEIMISIRNGDVINKKVALDKVMESEKTSDIQAQTLKNKTQSVLNILKKAFPQLHQTRFHQISDFYSLAVLFSKFENEKLILNDKTRNQLAWDLLVTFSNGVDKVRQLQKEIKSIPEELELHRQYLLTVSSESDSFNHRKNRENILKNLLQNIFEVKDSKRTFSAEQRRLLWNSADIQRCANCQNEITWENFTIDHIKPYSKGGRTELDNAAILCKSCNSRKGAR